jgi:hypothetical protein
MNLENSSLPPNFTTSLNLSSLKIVETCPLHIIPAVSMRLLSASVHTDTSLNVGELVGSEEGAAVGALVG